MPTSATATLLEATDGDFEWMIRGVAVPNRGLSLPPGGIDAKAVLAHVRAIARTLLQQWGRTASWMIVANGEVVGLCGYKNPPSTGGGVDIGYGVAASRRRLGHASSAVAAILADARRDPSIQDVFADTAVQNIASQGVLQKNGFERVGTHVDPEDGEALIRWRADVRTVPLTRSAGR
jgi:RimJ/RimL family protein N-acetyltransferase